ncbi:hypothetical protein OTU49_016618 [Cherax quadricarinatus]|uniref:Uncharacterized protein n=1 Tax=Cherax quadricarinatus TaxID=27406 RepID=A0AAW0Y7E6_CHEQU
MPRYAYQKPRNRLYSYDCYKPPLTLYFDKESSTKEKPGDQSFVEVKPPGYQPIWMKHPYRLPVEDIVVPPHESSIWPENIPHFSLVSSYDLMIDFLGIRKPCTFC